MHGLLTEQNIFLCAVKVPDQWSFKLKNVLIYRTLILVHCYYRLDYANSSLKILQHILSLQSEVHPHHLCFQGKALRHTIA
jgi:hypothetical protein